jgi:hypothetical protein
VKLYYPIILQGPSSTNILLIDDGAPPVNMIKFFLCVPIFSTSSNIEHMSFIPRFPGWRVTWGLRLTSSVGKILVGDDQEIRAEIAGRTGC